MRIRSTKPEFWRSERIARVSWDARLVLKGLESFVDDNGVGRDDLALIVGDLFQRDLVREPSRTLARVSESISELNQAGLVHRYRAQDTDLLFLSFWESVQRVDKPQPGRFPRPDGTLHYKDSLIREPDANIREHSRALAPGTEEQGNRGTEEQGIKPLSPADANDPNGTLIPNDWEPTQQHRDKAASLHLDVDQQAQRFIEHAHRTVRRLKNWNTGFTNWLRKQAEFNQQRQGRTSVPALRQSNAQRALELARSIPQEEDHGEETDRWAVGRSVND